MTNGARILAILSWTGAVYIFGFFAGVDSEMQKTTQAHGNAIYAHELRERAWESVGKCSGVTIEANSQMLTYDSILVAQINAAYRTDP